MNSNSRADTMPLEILESVLEQRRFVVQIIIIEKTDDRAWAAAPISGGNGEEGWQLVFIGFCVHGRQQSLLRRKQVLSKTLCVKRCLIVDFVWEIDPMECSPRGTMTHPDFRHGVR